MPLTRVYIDGLNLYHGIIRQNRFHWLNLEKFAEQLNGGKAVDRVIYCTAMVSGEPFDKDKALRQNVYHRALAIACPMVEIIKGQFTSHKGQFTSHKGQFTSHKKRLPLASCGNSPCCLVSVTVKNEKGSDVNLAARLLHDAHMGRYERAIVVSGDSDLTEPIRLVTQELKKEVWVRNPRDVHSNELNQASSNYSRIHPSVLQGSQLPNPVTDGAKS